MDPRIAARRASVKQATQRASLKTLGRVLTVAAVAAAAVWYLYSPFVDIDSIAVGGVVETDVEAALADAGIDVGDPLLLAPVGRLEERLAEDPWVASVSVGRIIPGILEISIVERVPVLGVDAAGRHSRIALDGMVLDKPATRPEDVPIFLDAVTQPAAGQPVEPGPVQDTLVFLEEFGPLSPLARFEMQDGELWLRLPDHDVRLAPGVDYQWFVALVTDPARRSNDVVSGAIIRYEPGAAPPASTPPERAAHAYAEAGLWYDAFDQVAAWLATESNAALLHAYRASLLEQVGLEAVARPQ